ncbi:YMGG-like glycine zipper-containing protein [Daejeonella sp.]|uniref:YMGG-like glycine zipper-containing protein n=1 Tax=Daejeonella sp. TaxID=2805397 RepID=UPI0039833657
MKRILLGFAFAAIVAGCNNNANEVASANAVRDSIRIADEKAKLDSFERAEIAEKAAAVAVANERSKAKSTSSKRSSSNTSNRAGYISDNGNVVYTTPQEAKKRGWSSAAKGAVIGGVVGAGTGILVDKKDGRGAAIGGVVGAGTGYVIGRSRDKRTGRVQ